jgi:hypothetical protein
MFKQFAFLFLLFVTYGCFIADEAINNKSEYSGSLSNRVKNAISKYVKDEYKDYQYHKYGFSDLIIHKPQELFKIDSLKSITPKSTQQKHQIQKSVDSLNAIIKTNQIKYWLEMDHVFNIKNKITKKIELFEVRFYLNDSIQVVRTKPLMFLELSQAEGLFILISFLKHQFFMLQLLLKVKT